MECNDVNEYDLVVIGGGSGGIAAARRAAGHGAKVVVVEGRELGGTCVNRGCVPKKLMFSAAQALHTVRAASALGIQGVDAAAVRLDLRSLKTARDVHVHHLAQETYPTMLEKAGVRLIRGTARFVGDKTLRVDGSEPCTVRGRHVLIATGSRPRALPVPGAQELTVTSDDIFTLENAPASVAIIGGGYVACEMACLLLAMGSRVTMLVRAQEGILNGFDSLVRARLREELTRQGVCIVSCAITEVAQLQQAGQKSGGQEDGKVPPRLLTVIGRQQIDDAANVVDCACGSTTRSSARARASATGQTAGYAGDTAALTTTCESHASPCACAPGEACPLLDCPVECVLSAVGRVGNSDSLHAQAGGIPIEKGTGNIPTDCFQNVTGCPGVYAVGDVTGRWLLTPVAIAAGRLLADRLFGGPHYEQARLLYNARSIPTVLFTHPPVGVVGLTEDAARETYGGDAVHVYTSSFVPLSLVLQQTAASRYAGGKQTGAATGTGGREGSASSNAPPAPPRTAVKLVCTGESQTVVGLHMIGEGADEVLQGFAVAVSAGLTKAQFDGCVAIHPTSAEEVVTLAPWHPVLPAPPALPATAVAGPAPGTSAKGKEGVVPEGGGQARPRAKTAAGTVAAPNCKGPQCLQ